MTNDLNFVFIEGTITNKPKARRTPKGIVVCVFEISSMYTLGIERTESFFDVVTSGDLGRKCSIMLERGQKVKIKGRLRMDGGRGIIEKDKVKVRIVAEKVYF